MLSLDECRHHTSTVALSLLHRLLCSTVRFLHLARSLLLVAFRSHTLVSSGLSERLLGLPHHIPGDAFNAILVHRRSPLVFWKNEAILLFGDLNGTEVASFPHHRKFAEQLARPRLRNADVDRALPTTSVKENVLPNPWMSAWLSAANAWVGAARGFWTADMHRQQTSMMNEMARQVVRFWQGSSMVPPAEKRKRGRR
jgi:hypothetical protein